MCSACSTNDNLSQDGVTTPVHAASERFALEGVSCGGCAAKITATVTAIDGVTDAHVDVATATLDITTVEGAGDGVAQQVRTAVRATGYGLN